MPKLAGSRNPSRSKRCGRTGVASILLRTTALRVVGPSKSLLPGPSLTGLSVERFKEVLRGASTDRSDFYHQVLVRPGFGRACPLKLSGTRPQACRLCWDESPCTSSPPNWTTSRDSAENEVGTQITVSNCCARHESVLCTMDI